MLSARGAVLITDADLNSTATLTLQHVSVQHLALQQHDPLLSVLPASVNASSVTCEGNWQDFVVTWQPVNNVDVNVTYDVVAHVTINGVRERLVTSSPQARVSLPWRPAQPHLPFTLTVTSVTAWGVSAPTEVSLHSPPSVPEPPRSLRYYVSPQEGELELRWLPPLQSNGVIQLYHVHLCDAPAAGADTQLCVAADNCTQLTLPGTQLQLHLHLPQPSFYFSVTAATSVGCGRPSEEVVVNTSLVQPAPCLLIASSTQVVLVDADLQTQRQLGGWGWQVAGGGVGAMLGNHTAFLQDTTNRLHAVDLLTNRTWVVASLAEPALAVAVDHVAEKLVWLQPWRHPLPQPLSHNTSGAPPRTTTTPPSNMVALWSADLTFGVRERLVSFSSSGTITHITIALRILPASESYQPRNPTSLGILPASESYQHQNPTSLRILPVSESYRPQLRILLFSGFSGGAERQFPLDSSACPTPTDLAGGLTYDARRSEVLVATNAAGIVAVDPSGRHCAAAASTALAD
ncbi:uncharacterized protein LOC125178488, partial [Hyalella azteca]|uniref:Uncharacterized protein LOC125178488 n=1 Tax=Hyalella azteca TaxID=294128 RepID=A0A979FQ28_HYAAZ